MFLRRHGVFSILRTCPSDDVVSYVITNYRSHRIAATNSVANQNNGHVLLGVPTTGGHDGPGVVFNNVLIQRRVVAPGHAREARIPGRGDDFLGEQSGS